jgi:hypothetical protein
MPRPTHQGRPALERINALATKGTKKELAVNSFLVTFVPFVANSVLCDRGRSRWILEFFL